MEEFNLPEEENQNIDNQNTNFFYNLPEIKPLICPSCKNTESVKFDTLRKTGSNKVKTMELNLCKNCGTVYYNLENLDRII